MAAAVRIAPNFLTPVVVVMVMMVMMVMVMVTGCGRSVCG